MSSIHTDYLNSVLNPAVLPKTLKESIAAIKKSGLVFDAIAVRGNSGTLFGGLLGYKLKKPVILVRKGHDDHALMNYRVEGPRDAKTYLIVDDFVASGATARTIIESVEKFNHAKPVGLLQYKYGTVESFMADWIDGRYDYKRQRPKLEDFYPEGYKHDQLRTETSLPVAWY